jgi:Kef-type K+ transport system membrane component KefB
MLLPKFFPSVFGGLASMPFGQAAMQAAPMYMGIMSTATSVGITARILSERKKMDSEEGVTIMAGAVIDDVLGLIVLAIGNGIIAATLAAGDTGTGSGTAGLPWSKIGMVAVKAFGVWLGATFIGVLVARKISWLLKMFKTPQAIATLAFGLSMILAGFFEFMGLAMIIGAYVMGLALSRTDLKHMIQETLSPVYTFLVPIFFCVMGMMVDVTALMSEPVLIFGSIYNTCHRSKDDRLRFTKLVLRFQLDRWNASRRWHGATWGSSPHNSRTRAFQRIPIAGDIRHRYNDDARNHRDFAACTDSSVHT